MSSGAIQLHDGDAAYVTSPAEVGTGDPEEQKAPLSEIIEQLNDRFGTDFTDGDRLFFEQVKSHAVNREAVRRMALVNPLEKFTLGIRPEIQKIMVERMAGNDDLVTRYLDDADFQEIVATGLAEAIYAAVTQEQPALPMDA